MHNFSGSAIRTRRCIPKRALSDGSVIVILFSVGITAPLFPGNIPVLKTRSGMTPMMFST